MFSVEHIGARRRKRGARGATRSPPIYYSIVVLAIDIVPHLCPLTGEGNHSLV